MLGGSGRAGAGPFREAAELRRRGVVKIALPDDHAPSLLTVLRVVHGRLALVPDTLAAGELHRVALVVDKYALHEPLRLQSDRWLDALARAPRPMPFDADDADFLAQLSIFWVFGRETRVAELARLAVRGWSRPFDAAAAEKRLPGELLVPAGVFGEKYFDLPPHPPFRPIFSFFPMPQSCAFSSKADAKNGSKNK
jgi:hypothetical protein